MWESLFKKSCRPGTLFKRDSNTGSLPVNIAKFLKTVFFIEHPGYLLLINRGGGFGFEVPADFILYGTIRSSNG